MVGAQTRAEVVEEMAPQANQSSVVHWAPLANPLHVMVDEMVPQAHQSSGVHWAPLANPL